VTRLLKKLTHAQEKTASGAPSASTPASTSASTVDFGCGFDLSLGSVLLPGSTPHLASPAPYFAPISPHLGEAALPGEGKYLGGGDDQPPNDVLAQSCGQTAGAWSGGGGVGLTDTTLRLTDPLPGFLSSHAVSFSLGWHLIGRGEGADAWHTHCMHISHATSPTPTCLAWAPFSSKL
jgi:hypothetical protein